MDVSQMLRKWRDRLATESICVFEYLRLFSQRAFEYMCKQDNKIFQKMPHPKLELEVKGSKMILEPDKNKVYTIIFLFT